MMIKRLRQTVVTAGAASLLLAGNAVAAEHSYDYAELRYVHAEIDGNGGSDPDGNGLEIAGSMEIADYLHLFGSYQALDYDFGIDTSSIELGVGYMTPIATGADFVARLSYLDGEVDTGFGDFDDSGYGVSVGVRKSFAQQFEGRAFINHVDLDDSGTNTSIVVAGDYFINDQFAAGLSVEFGDDASAITLGGRYYFGRMGRR